jgi:hypothetical protein
MESQRDAKNEAYSYSIGNNRSEEWINAALATITFNQTLWNKGYTVFAGFIAKGVAEQILSHQDAQDGDFIIRFSDSQSSCIAIAHRIQDTIKHFLIKISQDDGSVTILLDDHTTLTFDNLTECLMAIDTLLNTIWIQDGTLVRTSKFLGFADELVFL